METKAWESHSISLFRFLTKQKKKFQKVHILMGYFFLKKKKKKKERGAINSYIWSK